MKQLPGLKAKQFDLSICLHNLLVLVNGNGTFKMSLAHIGFDATLIHSTKPSISTESEAATFHGFDLCLRDGEKGKVILCYPDL